MTAGQAEFIAPMASAGVAAGVDGVFLEVHENPRQAKSDAQNALRLDLLEPLLEMPRPHRRRVPCPRAGLRGLRLKSDTAPMSTDTASALDLARKVLRTEAAAILGLVDASTPSSSAPSRSSSNAAAA